MKRNIAVVSTLALGLSPVLAQAGGEIVAPPPPPPQPVVVPAPQPEPVAPAPMPAPQEDRDGPYVSLFGGASWLPDADFGPGQDEEEFFGNGFEEDEALGEFNFNTGWVVGGAVGYTTEIFGFAPRVEIEGAYRQHGLDEAEVNEDNGIFNGDNGLFNGGDLAEFGGDGEVQVFSGLVNAWFDVPVFGFRPYVGGGVGAARVWANDLTATSTFTNGGTSFLVDSEFDESDIAFAWQVGAGVGFEVTDDLTAFVDYRYFNVSDPKLGGDEGGDLELDYNTHNALAGLRFTF